MESLRTEIREFIAKNFYLSDPAALSDDASLIDLGTRMILKHALRAADSLHLAAAVQLARDIGRKGLHFATADGEQAEAAAAENLKVIRLAL